MHFQIININLECQKKVIFYSIKLILNTNAITKSMSKLF